MLKMVNGQWTRTESPGGAKGTGGYNFNTALPGAQKTAPQAPSMPLSSAQRTAAFSPKQLAASADRLGMFGGKLQPAAAGPTTSSLPRPPGMSQVRPTTFDMPPQQPSATGAPSATGNPSPMAGPGGIDFSGLKPSYGYSMSNNNSSNVSHSGLSDMGNKALSPLLGTGPGSMPGNIDDWTNKILGNLTVSQNDIMDRINQAANAQAKRGILGGTEATNLRASMLTQLMNPTLQRQADAMQQALGLKTQVMPQLIGLTQQSSGLGAGGSNSYSYNQSPDDYQIIAQMLNNQW